MVGFCTNCGQKVDPNCAFCIGCGERVKPEKTEVSDKTTGENTQCPKASPFVCFFSRNSVVFEEYLLYKQKICLVVTNTTELRTQLGKNYHSVEDSVFRLFGFNSILHTRYLLLDLSNTNLGLLEDDHDWRHVVEILQRATQKIESRLRSKLDSIFIIGDETIVPMASHGNPVGKDADVDSDFCYSCLSTQDPWESIAEPTIPVGRLPIGKTAGSQVAMAYFNLRQRLFGQEKCNHESFGLGAEVWSGATQATFNLFNGRKLKFSPPMSSEEALEEIQPEVDLLFFNLHGSNERDASGWFGESKNREFIEAITPSTLESLRSPNVIGVEACYGARFQSLDINESCLLSALCNKTIAFVGSSRIAFGPPDPPIGLADVIVGNFLENFSSGFSAGYSHLNARMKLFDDASHNAHARLTILQFNLFGDPMVRTFAQRKSIDPSSEINFNKSDKIKTSSPATSLRADIRASTHFSRDKISASIRKINLSSDIYSEIRSGISVNAKIAANFLSINFPDFADQNPNTTAIKISDTIKVIYNYTLQTNMKGIFRGISMLQDCSDGKIEQVYITK